MKYPRFLSIENVHSLHAETIRIEGGTGGIRDLGLLESAVLMPQQQFGGAYLHPTIPAMAAAYLFHMACNHPFIDANKRTAAAAAFVFLDANNHELTASAHEFEAIVMQVASGGMRKTELTEWFERMTRRAKR
jgi:death-on-curing protein